jgi:hypothetical protein
MTAARRLVGYLWGCNLCSALPMSGGDLDGHFRTAHAKPTPRGDDYRIVPMFDAGTENLELRAERPHEQ